MRFLQRLFLLSHPSSRRAPADLPQTGRMPRPFERRPAGRRSGWRNPLGAWLAPLLLLPLPLIPIETRAQKPLYALACVGTETGYTVNFAYRWGTQSWQQRSVAPGRWIKLYWNYDYPGENRSPTLTIRYDDDLTNRSNMVRTDLKAYAAAYLDCEKQGKTYNFYARGDELYVQEED